MMMPKPGATSTVQFSPSAARWINAWIKSVLLEKQFLQKQGEVVEDVCTCIYIKKKTLAQQLDRSDFNWEIELIHLQPPIDSVFNGSQFLMDSITRRLSLFVKRTYKSKKRPLQATLKNRRR